MLPDLYYKIGQKYLCKVCFEYEQGICVYILKTMCRGWEKPTRRLEEILIDYARKDWDL